MTNKEKDFLRDWIYKEWNRAERDFFDNLNSLYKHHNEFRFIDNLIKSFYRYRFYVTFYQNLNDVLELDIFDDTTKYKNRSAEYLNRFSITEREDELIYSFIVGIIHGKKFIDIEGDKNGKNRRI